MFQHKNTRNINIDVSLSFVTTLDGTADEKEYLQTIYAPIKRSMPAGSTMEV